MGKTQLVKGKLASLPEDLMSLSISFNYFTDVVSFQKVGCIASAHTLGSCSQWLWLGAAAACETSWFSLACFLAHTHELSVVLLVLQVLEAPLEKKAGINYGPPGTKHLVYFVDDLNMPKLDPYETAMPISLIRQHLSWGHWFGKQEPRCSTTHALDVQPSLAVLPGIHTGPNLLWLLWCADRAKLTPKNINNTQYVACMNPTAGSFVVNPRLQRLFMTLAVDFPGQDSLMTIYGTFLQVPVCAW